MRLGGGMFVVNCQFLSRVVFRSAGAGGDYAVRRNNLNNLRDIASQNSLPTKEATIRLGGGILVVNCHFLTRNDSFPIERTGRVSFYSLLVISLSPTTETLLLHLMVT
jgi:hypothetical protein